MAAPSISLSTADTQGPSDSVPNPQNTIDGDDKSPLPRTRSVQFSNPDISMSRSVSPRTSSQQQQQAESSADEITPIVNRERGGAKNKSYDGTSTGQPTVNAETNASRHSSTSSARRRKTGPGPKTSETATGEEDESPAGGWWKDLVEKYGSIELDNKGSAARDHLALERTFLAWLRTSLAFASIGIAITQLFRLNTTINERDGLVPANPDGTYRLRQVGKPLGATFLGIAIVVLLVGGRRYFESQYWIIRGKFPASRGSIFLVTFIAMALIITSLVVVIAVSPTIFEKK
ncbi:hypothetical protein JMJ35_001765 [Cladonia borealis]|uniref:DUF202 domain-containing protein n=1 Tax=Cladonia borealis TaxID=184061 RepID=A0AA39R7X1_9LECA|nr:hypothetical protein JMJ35_001765 [Cladonia borealis]